jgi:hypothetical protein
MAAKRLLPCLSLLEATPGILRGLTTELTDGDMRWKPAPERFSVAEVLAHLSHSESHCYKMRLDRLWPKHVPNSILMMRKSTSICTVGPIRTRPSITSRISGR